MILKGKSWWWKLTGPFASDNYTTIGHLLYFPKDAPPNARVIKHEETHEKQWMQAGFLKFYFLYLFALPILWNSWRFKWEFEAYSVQYENTFARNSELATKRIIAILRSKAYGWLRNK